MKACYICDKGYQRGKSVTFSHKSTIKRFQVNLSTRTVKDGNNTKKVSVCTSCIKAGKA